MFPQNEYWRKLQWTLQQKSVNKLWIKGSICEKMEVCKMEIGCMGEAQKSDISSWHRVRSTPNQAPFFLQAVRKVTGRDFLSFAVLSMHPMSHLLDMPAACC